VPFILVGALLALVCAPALNALALGDDRASASASAARAVSAVSVVPLCGVATAAAGPIGFVGARRPARGADDHRREASETGRFTDS